jgi:hypothetical protein
MDYYSVRLLVLILVDDGKPRKLNTCDHQFVIFRARDDQHAFQRALKWGKKLETRYKNIKGQWVRWAFAEVVSIKLLGKKLDGLEIGSALADHRSKTPIPFNKRFHPKKSKVAYD